MTAPVATRLRRLVASLGVALVAVVVAAQVAAACDVGGANAISTTATASATATGSVRLMAVGDVMLARTIGDRIQQDGPDVVFAGVDSQLAGITVLEAAQRRVA